MILTPPHPTPSLLHINIHPLLPQPTDDFACFCIVLHAQGSIWCIFGCRPYPTPIQPRAVLSCNLQYLVLPPFKTCRKMNILMHFLQATAEWCHSVKMDPSRALVSSCFGIVLYHRRKTLCIWGGGSHPIPTMYNTF